MDRSAAKRTIDLFESRNQLEPIASGGAATARDCLDRAAKHLSALPLLMEAQHWETAFTTAYDAYRTAADAIVLPLGYRVPAVKGAHRVPTDIVHALRIDAEIYGPTTADRFRSGRHQSEYFDPDRPADKTRDDADWAVTTATTAVAAVEQALRNG